MAMSLNSAESKTSPHFWHSTNSASSSRATILTMGCLHLAVIGGGIREWYGFCPSSLSLSTGICSSFSGENRGEVMVNLWWNRWKSLVAIQASEDVHYLGLELSEFRLFSGREASKKRHASSDQKSGLRSDGSEVPGRADGRERAQRQGHSGGLPYPSAVAGEDFADAGEGRAAGFTCGNEWWLCAFACGDRDYGLRGDPGNRRAAVH